MERYNGVNPPFICSSCPKKTFGDCHSLLIHSVLTHDKSFVMKMHNQASVVNELEPVPLMQQNLKGPASSKKRKFDKTSPKSPRKSPRLGQIKDSYPSIRIPKETRGCSGKYVVILPFSDNAWLLELLRSIYQIQQNILFWNLLAWAAWAMIPKLIKKWNR